MFSQILEIAKLGGIAIYPLVLLGVIATALIIDKIIFYRKLVILPKATLQLIETYDFDWSQLESALQKLSPENSYRKFFDVILTNKTRPIWWLESRALDEASLIEKRLISGMWILETIVTAAPLLGLLGTITGMMEAFKLIGGNGLVNPTGVSAGVAQALIATAVGLAIALIALFAFNYFSRLQDQVLDEMQRLGTRLIDHARIDRDKFDLSGE